MRFFPLRASAEAAPGKDAGGAGGSPGVGAPLPGVRRGPASGSARVSSPRLCTLPRGPPPRGGASAEARWQPAVLRGEASAGLLGVGCARQLGGHGPQAARPGTGHRPGDAGRMVAAGPERAGALAPPAWGCPAAVRPPLGVFCQAQWPRAAPRGGRAGGPGTCHARPAGLGGASVGARALGPALPGGLGRREQPAAGPPCAWGGKPGQVAQGGAPGTATVQGPPRRAGRASPTAGPRQAWPCSGRAWSRRWRRAVGAVPARPEAWHPLGGAGGGQTPAASHRRGAGPPWARPTERLSGLRQQAWRRPVASGPALSVSSRARGRSRRASSATVGTETAVRAPARARRASGLAARRLVWTRAPAWCGLRAGAPPSRPRRCAAARGRAKSPRGLRHRRSGGVGLWLASAGRGDRCHPAAAPGCPGRSPQR